MAQVRPYRGVEAADRVAERRRRFLEAGLDILGSDPDLSERSVSSGTQEVTMISPAVCR